MKRLTLRAGARGVEVVTAWIEAVKGTVSTCMFTHHHHIYARLHARLSRRRVHVFTGRTGEEEKRRKKNKNKKHGC